MTTPTATQQHQPPAKKAGPQLARWSDTAQARLRLPPQRGTFRPLDAARAQLALLSVADSAGQARIYWLIDLEQQQVADARFLAYGDLSSHPLADAFCALAKGQSLDQATAMDPNRCEAELRDDPQQPAFGSMDDANLSFISELQRLARAAAPQLSVLPKPVEVERYTRKREQEWDEFDRAWLPLSLMKKLMQAQKVGNDVLHERSGRQLEWSVEGLHDDFRIKARFAGVAADQVPTLIAFLAEGLQQRIHPQITVEEAES